MTRLPSFFGPGMRLTSSAVISGLAIGVKARETWLSQPPR
jgi:hypothetical protein